MTKGDFFRSLLLPEKEVKDKAQNYAYEYGSGERKIDCKVVLLVIEVSGKAADIGNLLAEGEDNSYDNDCYAYYNEEFANWLKGLHEGILTRGMEGVKGDSTIANLSLYH